MRSPLAALPLLVWCLLPACTWAHGDPYVLVTSVPAGATILVDGEEIEPTTPAMVELGGVFGTDHEISVRKEGYHPTSRVVTHRNDLHGSRWIDGGADFAHWPNPLFWTPGDFLFPFEANWGYVPNALRIVLYPVEEPPLGGNGP